MNNIGDTGSRNSHRNWYCPKCKVTGLKSAHDEGCDGGKLMISATARFPKKNASKKVWDAFYDKSVLRKDIKEFFNKRSTKYKRI
jgi:hypothetical protein